MGLLIGWYLWWRGRQAPWNRLQLSASTSLVLSGIARFLVEFIRRNPKIIWGLSNAQLASAGSVVAGICLILWAARRPAIEPDATTEAVGKAA